MTRSVDMTCAKENRLNEVMKDKTLGYTSFPECFIVRKLFVVMTN
jgi:hypothetical protein